MAAELDKTDADKEGPSAVINEQFDLAQYDINERGQAVPLPSDSEKEADIHEYFAKVSAELTRGIETNEEGINTERVRAFVDSLGLGSSATVYLLDEANYATYKSRLASFSLDNVAEAVGGFIPGINHVIVLRDSGQEEQYGVGITERNLVHELAHASTTQQTYLYRNLVGPEGEARTTVGVGRVGQMTAVPDGRAMRGVYNEEGFAETVATLYTKSVLGLENGFEGDDEPQLVETEEGILELPNNLVINGQIPKASVAALGYSFLLEKDPTLLDSFILARTNPKGLQQVQSKISAIGREVGWPDLYNDLWRCEDDDYAFMDITQKLVAALDPAKAQEWSERYEEQDNFIEARPVDNAEKRRRAEALLSYYDQQLNEMLQAKGDGDFADEKQQRRFEQTQRDREAAFLEVQKYSQ